MKGEKNGMKKIVENLAKLINVKSIVTLALTVVFAVLSLKGVITADQFISIFTVIIAFYFGTQYEKKNEKVNESEEKGEQ